MQQMPSATEIKAAFALRLANVRKAKGFESARDAADTLGVQENTYTSWERGSKSPQYFNLVAIKRLWGVPLDYLIDGDASHLSVQMFNKIKKMEALPERLR